MPERLNHFQSQADGGKRKKMNKDFFAKTFTTRTDGVVGSDVNFAIKTDHRSLDVPDLVGVHKVMNWYKTNVIIYSAAEMDADRCERDPNYADLVITIVTFNLATSVRKIGAKLVYASTSEVFDGSKKRAYKETDSPNSQNYYARSKYFGEIVVREILKSYLIVKASWTFGDGLRKDQKFDAKIIEQLNKKKIKAVNDQVGSSTFGKDLIEGIKQLVLSNQKGIFHLSNKASCFYFKFVKQIVSVMNSEVQVVPFSSGFFQLAAQRGRNEAMQSKVTMMRP
jgi:dTDP-4-dehydrorhamnose reductase